LMDWLIDRISSSGVSIKCWKLSSDRFVSEFAIEPARKRIR
jgi:hypothetical protein